MSTNNILPLQRAASLLRVGVAALDCEPAFVNPDDILEMVRVAKERIGEWLDNVSSKTDDEGAFDALDVLTLAESVLAAGLDPTTNGRTISPVRGALKVAATLLAPMAFYEDEPELEARDEAVAA